MWGVGRGRNPKTRLPWTMAQGQPVTLRRGSPLPLSQHPRKPGRLNTLVEIFSIFFLLSFSFSCQFFQGWPRFSIVDFLGSVRL